jgi:hypothetical protein
MSSLEVRRRSSAIALSPTACIAGFSSLSHHSVFERFCSVQVALGTADRPEGPGALLAT